MKLRKRFILILMKMVNTERYEFQHPLSDKFKTKINKSLLPLNAIEKKSLHLATNNSVFSERLIVLDLIFKDHNKHIRDFQKRDNNLVKTI